MRSATTWTSVWDLDDHVLYIYSQRNRRVRSVRLGAVNFEMEGTRRLPLDRERTQDLENVTPVY